MPRTPPVPFLLLPVPLVLLALLTACAPTAQIAPPTEQEVHELVRAYDDSWARRDTAAIGRLLGDSYQYFTSRGGIWSRERTLGLVASRDYVLSDAERTEVEVRLDGATAVVSSRWRGHGTYGEETFDDDQRCSLVLVRHPDRWRLLAEHCTQIEPE